MKRMLSRVLALALCLCMTAASSLAAEMPAATAASAIIPPMDGYTWNFDNVVPVGDSVYVMTASGQRAQLWRWQEGMARAEEVAQELVYAARFTSLEEAAVMQRAIEQADAMHALDRIFTDGEQLYGYNSLNKLVFAIDVTEEGLQYTDLAELTFLSSGSYNQPISLLKAGNWLLWFEADQNSLRYSERLLAFNLETGAVKQAVMPEMIAISSYKDGKALVLCETVGTQAGEYAVYAYDPRTDLAECLGMLPSEMNVRVRRIAYSPAFDMLVYQAQTRIMGWMAEGGAEQIGYIPTTMNASIAVLGDTLLYAADSPEVVTAALARGYATEQSLTLMGATMYTALGQFAMSYRDVPVYYTDRQAGETYAQAFSRREDVPDLVYLSASGSGYEELLAEGCLLDLSAYADVKAYVDALYPAYREFVTKDGGIYGVPVNAYSYNGWYINKEVMTAMGLTAEDIPTSLTEMIAFADRWNDDFAERYPHYTLLNNTGAYRERFVEILLDEWSEYCQYMGKELTFDDPVFRECLAALDAAAFDKLDAALRQTDPEVSEYKQALIWTGCQDVANWGTYMLSSSDRIFIPLTLTPETPYTAAVDTVKLWVVNAKTDSPEYAAALLAEQISCLDTKDAYTLRSDMTAPILNDGYEEILAYEQDVLASLEARLEDSVNKATIERRIAEQKEYIEVELARRMYDINPSAIENYVNVIAPASFVYMQGAFPGDGQGEQYANLVDGLMTKTLTADEFIAQMDALMKEAQ